MTETKYTPKFLARFWSRVDRTAGMLDCWLWTARKNADGYGCISIYNKERLAHRISYDIAYGNLTADLLVLHTCDNPSCVNPYHLFLGTDLDNVRDKEQKSRGNHVHGEQHGQCKLTDTQVDEIRHLYMAEHITQ